MATSEFWQRISATVSQPDDWAGDAAESKPRNFQSKSSLWILLDVVTIFLAAAVATTYEMHKGPVAEAREFYRGNLFHHRSMGILLAFLCGFSLALIATSKRMNLYNPASLTSFLRVLRITVQVAGVRPLDRVGAAAGATFF